VPEGAGGKGAQDQAELKLRGTRQTETLKTDGEEKSAGKKNGD